MHPKLRQCTECGRKHYFGVVLYILQLMTNYGFLMHDIIAILNYRGDSLILQIHPSEFLFTMMDVTYKCPKHFLYINYTIF